MFGNGMTNYAAGPPGQTLSKGYEAAQAGTIGGGAIGGGGPSMASIAKLTEELASMSDALAGRLSSAVVRLGGHYPRNGVSLADLEQGKVPEPEGVLAVHLRRLAAIGGHLAVMGDAVSALERSVEG